MARYNRKWDSARTALGAIPGAEVSDVRLCKNRRLYCGADGGCFWNGEEKGTKRINQERFDQFTPPSPQSLAVGLSTLHDTDGRRAEVAFVRGIDGRRDISELIVESTDAASE